MKISLYTIKKGMIQTLTVDHTFSLLYGGGEEIRTPATRERSTSFPSQPLQPLGYPSRCFIGLAFCYFNTLSPEDKALMISVGKIVASCLVFKTCLVAWV